VTGPLQAAIVDLAGTLVDTLHDFEGVLVTYGYNHGEPVCGVAADAFIDRLDDLQLDRRSVEGHAARGRTGGHPATLFRMFASRKQTKGSNDRGAWPWRGPSSRA
jgi:hypothetical protein